MVTEVVRPDGSAVRYFYDREQELVRVVNESGEEHRYVRRGEGRIDEEWTFDGRQIHYRHDVMGRITQIRDGVNRVEFAYDPCGRLVERSLTEGVTPDGLPSGVQVTGRSATPALRPGEPAWVGPLPHEVTLVQSYGWCRARCCRSRAAATTRGQSVRSPRGQRPTLN